MNDPSSFALFVHGKTPHKGMFHLKHQLESHIVKITYGVKHSNINKITETAISVVIAHNNTVNSYLYLHQ